MHTAIWCLCALSAFAQSSGKSSMERMVADDAITQLRSNDPITRGEAAIIVAASGNAAHESRILELANDPRQEARHRAMLALGLLASPAAISQLETTLANSRDRTSDDGVIAAFALGMIPSDRIGTAVARTLPLFARGSWKRQHDVLSALLLGMSRQPARSEAAALRQLLDNDANRSADIRGLILNLLLHVDNDLEPQNLKRILRRGSEPERLAILQWLASLTIEERAPWLNDLTQIATNGSSAKIRTSALLALTCSRHLPALDLAAKAIKKSSPAECRQAITTILAIGGASTRGALEEHILAERNPDRMAALMQGYLAPPSKLLIDHAIKISTDSKLPMPTRTAAALLVSRADPKLTGAILRDLFRSTADPRLLTTLAHAIQRSGETPMALSRLLDRPAKLAQHGNRWQALLRAGHSSAQRQILAVLQDSAASDDDRRAALQAWRKAMILSPSADNIPDVLSDCLR
jgi:hypothetical protein